MHAGSVLKNVRPLILETAAKLDHSLVLAREVESGFLKGQFKKSSEGLFTFPRNG
jgi:hypothetical protein